MLQIHVLHNNCKEIYEGIFPQRKFVFPEGIFYNLINYLVEDLKYPGYETLILEHSDVFLSNNVCIISERQIIPMHCKFYVFSIL